MPRLLLLVPTASYRAGAFVDAARRLDLDVTIASEEPSTLASFVPADLIKLDFSDPRTCARYMKAFARDHPIDAVVGVDDQVTVVAAAIGESLGLAHNPVAAAEATRNKHTMRVALRAAGVPVPRFRLAGAGGGPAAAAVARYPCVIKPLAMAASRGVIRADNPADFIGAFERVAAIVSESDASPRNLLIEDYIPGWEVAVEGILSDGELHVLTIFDKPDPLEGPYFPETIYTTPSRLPQSTQRRIESLTVAAIHALGLRHGPIHAEIRGDGDALCFIEVAARSIGGYCSRVFRFEGELTLEDVILLHALDPRYAVPPREHRAAGVMMMQAPRRGVFRRARGLDAARAVPGIDEVILSAHAGQTLSPLPEGFLYLGFLFARGDSPDEVEKTLRRATSHIELDIVGAS